MKLAFSRCRSLLENIWLTLLVLVFAVPTAWASSAPMTGASASATITSSSPVTMSFPLVRSGGSTSAISVHYATQDGTATADYDYMPTSGVIDVPAGATGVSIPVQILGASEYSPDKEFILNVAVGSAFAIQQIFGAGLNPGSVTTADVNGDGKPDLIVVNESSDNVSVLLNTTSTGATTPSFATQQTFAVGSHPYSVTAADVNGDGKPDLIVANGYDNDVSVLLNTTATGATAPSFAVQRIFATGSMPGSITAADVNGDGKPDLIVANDDSSVSVLLNTTATGATTPSFAAQQTFATSSYSVTTADVNGDGKPDLIVTSANSNNVSVLLNTTATGATIPSFAAQQAFGTGGFPDSVAAADVNGDGKLDLIATNFNDNDVSVLLNTTTTGASTLSFATQQTFGTGRGPVSVTVADVNSDGKPDLIVANDYGDTVSVLRNTTATGASTPSFTIQQFFNTGSGPNSVTAADVNGDNKPDIITANYGDNDVSVLLNTQIPGSVSPPSLTGTIHYAIPEAVFSPGSLAFGTVAEGSNPTETEKFTNAGGAALVISSIAIRGNGAPDFSQSSNCPASLAIGASCAINVSYTPEAGVTALATLTVTTNEANSPDTVDLAGTGAAGAAGSGGGVFGPWGLALLAALAMSIALPGRTPHAHPTGQ